MNRLEFLKTLGFRGASLIAVLQACTKDTDSYVEALTVDAYDTDINAIKNTTDSTGTNSGSGSGNIGEIPIGNAPSSYLLKIDLSNSSAGNLSQIGGYIVQNRIVVAQVSSGNYAAATVTCSHQPRDRVIYYNNEWYCTDHGARFSLTGSGINSRASRGLQVYKTTVDGNFLYIS